MTLGQIVVIGVFGSMGCFLSALALKQLAGTVRFLRSGIRTTATVVGYETVEIRYEKEQATKRSFHPMIEFEDASGGKQRVTLQEGEPVKFYAESYPVSIIYKADDPKSARIGSYRDLWINDAMLLAIGLSLLAGAIATWAFDASVSFVIR